MNLGSLPQNNVSFGLDLLAKFLIAQKCVPTIRPLSLKTNGTMLKKSLSWMSTTKIHHEKWSLVVVLPPWRNGLLHVPTCLQLTTSEYGRLARVAGHRRNPAGHSCRESGMKKKKESGERERKRKWGNGSPRGWGWEEENEEKNVWLRAFSVDQLF